MIEDDQTRSLWERMKLCPYLLAGLRKAGFRGGWLEFSWPTR
jgi:hypothetical protein